MTRRLLWIHQNYVHHSQAGNARAGFLLRALTDNGWQVDLLTGTQSYFGDGVAEGTHVDNDGRLRIHRVAPRSGQKSQQYLDFSRLAVARARRLPRPDVVFASTPPLPQLAPSLALSAWWRCPLVLEIRDLWPAFLVDGGMLKPGPLVAALRILEATAMHHSKQTVLVGPAYLPYVEGMGIDASQITVAPTGALANASDEQAAATWRRSRGLEDKTLVLYAGSFNEAYDVPLMLAAAGQCDRNDIVWLIAGNGRGRPDVEHAASQHAHIVDLGSLPRNELDDVLAAADIGLLPHADWPLLGITISGKLFEYMAASLAVVSVRDGTMGEIVREAGCGVVLDQVSATHLLEAVHGLADHPERASMGARGQRWVLDHVEAHAMAERIHKVVERCRQGPQRRRLIRATARGIIDGLRNRSEHVLNDRIRPNTQQLAQRSLAAWLRSGESP